VRRETKQTRRAGLSDLAGRRERRQALAVAGEGMNGNRVGKKTLGCRVSGAVADDMKRLAKQEGITVQEVWERAGRAYIDAINEAARIMSGSLSIGRMPADEMDEAELGLGGWPVYRRSTRR
jgi:hypothetical protein